MSAMASTMGSRALTRPAFQPSCKPPRVALRAGAVRPCRPCRRPQSAVQARIMVTDPASNAQFPLAQTFWEGAEYRCLGATTRNKKIVVVNVKVYSVALYVEADRCAKELGIRYRGGFFENDDDYCQAVLDGAFHKVLQIRLLRDVDGPTFADAISKYLEPRMRLSGDMESFNQFVGFFSSKQLTNGTEVSFVLNPAGDLACLSLPAAPGATATYESQQPELRIKSPSLGRALFEVYLGGSPAVPEAKPMWAKGAQELLDSEQVNRETRKSGA